MRWQGRRESTNVEDRRNSRGNFRGRKQIGVLSFIILLVGAYYGVDLSGLVGTPDFSDPISLNTQEQQRLDSLSRVVLADTENVWGNYFAQHNQSYHPPIMVLYNRETHTACGMGQAAIGPFYCPNDYRLYLDLSFYNDMRNQLDAEGDSAFAYVIAHEVGHHIQNLLGILPKVHQAQRNLSPIQANQLSVKLELQADCFAGVWASQASKIGLFETGDIEKIFRAAQAVGDDRLQKRTQGYIVPDSFTHGTSAQRLAWFKRGFQSGQPRQCDTFD